MAHVVNGRIWVFAYPDPSSKRDRKGPIDDSQRLSWPYRQLDPQEIDDTVSHLKQRKFKNDPNPYQDLNGPWYVIPYDGLNDLIFGLYLLLRDETWATGTGAAAKIIHNPCLFTLEIWSHGNPDRCGGITADTVEAFAVELDKLNLCDEFDIYLTGCNTGCRNWKDDTDQVSDEECIAELLAEQLPGANHPNKSYRVTVYGSKGYHRDTHAGGDGESSRHIVEGNPPRYLGAYPKSVNARQSENAEPTFRGFRGPNSA